MFQFKPVVRDLPTLAKTIGGRLEIIRGDRTRNEQSRWIARIAGPPNCLVAFRTSSNNFALFSPSETGPTPTLARLRLARRLSRQTFVVRDTASRTEHYLPLGIIRP